ncbi:MAG: hypothetical protein ACRD0G_04970 [Acidimicrobiales bacterium]
MVPWVLAGILLLTTVGMAAGVAVFKSDRDDLAAVDEEIRDVRELASRFADTLLSFDAANADAIHDDIIAMSIPPFTDQFEEAFGETGVMRQAFEQMQATAQTTIKDIFVGEIDEETATAIVVYDRLLIGPSTTVPERNIYLRLIMTRVDGEWRVSDVINLVLGLGTGVEPPSTGDTPSTTAPSPTGS